MHLMHVSTAGSSGSAIPGCVPQMMVNPAVGCFGPMSECLGLGGMHPTRSTSRNKVFQTRSFRVAAPGPPLRRRLTCAALISAVVGPGKLAAPQGFYPAPCPVPWTPRR
jgi:hypothetical protein